MDESKRVELMIDFLREQAMSSGDHFMVAASMLSDYQQLMIDMELLQEKQRVTRQAYDELREYVERTRGSAVTPTLTPKNTEDSNP